MKKITIIDVVLVFGIIQGVTACNNKREIVLRGGKLGYKCCESDKQSDTENNGILPMFPPTTPATTTSAPTIIPVGDCLCGTNVEQKLKNGKLNRPWAVHIKVKHGAGTVVECSGSLINRKWIISAAHCFCKPLRAAFSRNDMECTAFHRGFNKTLNSTEIKDSITLQFGTSDEALKRDKVSEVAQLIIHPDYYEDQLQGTLKKTSADMALIQTTDDVYTEDGMAGSDGDWIIHPICLPPPGEVTWDMLQKPDMSHGEQFSKGVYIPFEDMDCKLFLEKGPGIPSGLSIEAGWLSCHPGAFTSPHHVSITGRTSFITAFSTTSKINDNKKCFSNSFGPDQSIFRACKDGCKRNETNPSLDDADCKELRDTKSTAMIKDDPVLRFVIKSEREDMFCYPWKNPEEVQLFGQHPYKGGWCNTECDETISNCDETSSNWGWCIEGCDQKEPREFGQNIHEIEVDAFVYENCSRNVDIKHEFCTGSPITRPKQHNVKKLDGEFFLMNTDPETWHQADINSTSIRQHSSSVGDACYGDAGGSVWKFFKFKDPGSDSGEHKNKLAVLTGIVSRYESECGAFQGGGGGGVPDAPNLPTQHTIHTRVRSHLKWILEHAWSEASCDRLPAGQGKGNTKLQRNLDREQYDDMDKADHDNGDNGDYEDYASNEGNLSGEENSYLYSNEDANYDYKDEDIEKADDDYIDEEFNDEYNDEVYDKVNDENNKAFKNEEVEKGDDGFDETNAIPQLLSQEYAEYNSDVDKADGVESLQNVRNRQNNEEKTNKIPNVILFDE